MANTVYENEIGERLAKRIKAGRVYFVWLVLSNVLALLVLYGYSFLTFGYEFAFQNTVQQIVVLLAFESVVGFLYVVYVGMWEIPSEIYYEQKKVIDENLPGQLALNIEKGPNTFTKNDVTLKVASLMVTSQEKQKIVELQALINFEHTYFRPGKNYVSGAIYEMYLPLYWGGMKVAEEIEMRPETPRVLYVSELGNFKTDKNEKVCLAIFGGNRAIYSADFGKESVFRLKITFQGKLEGEHNFRTNHYECYLYTDAERERILLTEQVKALKGAYADIPEKLLSRSVQSRVQL